MGDISVLLYTEIDLICFFIAVTCLLFSYHNQPSGRRLNYFHFILIALSIFIIMDVFWQLSITGVLSPSTVDLYIITGLYFTMCGIIGFLWFLFSESRQNSPWLESRGYFILSIIPLLVMVLLNITTAKTGILYLYDSEGNYYRGYLFFINYILPYSYVILTAVKAVARGLNYRFFSRKEEFLALAAFPLFTILNIAVILDEKASATPVAVMCITFATFFVHQSLQRQMISIDSLTQLANRHRMIRFLNTRIQKNRPDHFLFLIILDLVEFKKINDTYGHIAGDGALVQAASVLKGIEKEYGGLAGRYGGDEFIYTFETSTPSDIDIIIERIHKDMALSNERRNDGLKVETAAGYALYNYGIKDAISLIDAADKNLYRFKQKKTEEIN